MSEVTNSFVSVGMPLGSARLTISAPNTLGLSVHLNELTEVDPMDEISAISAILENIQAIDAASTLVFGGSKPAYQASTPAAPTTQTEGKTCAHGAMKYKTGTSKKNGKPYAGWFCTAPMGAQQCDAIFSN